jgi:pimeloyl-ACP methyl ester carboxylesterase
VDRVHLVGLSIGGMVSQAFAIRNVHRLHSLVLSSTLPASVPNATDLWRPRVEAVLAAGSVAAIADSTLDRWLSDDYRQANPRRWGEIQEMVASTSVDGFLGCVGALEDFDFRDELPTLSAPSLVVCGARDSSSTPEANRAIASMLKARYEEIPDALHLVPVEKSEQFGALLLSWLNDTRSS